MEKIQIEDTDSCHSVVKVDSEWDDEVMKGSPVSYICTLIYIYVALAMD